MTRTTLTKKGIYLEFSGRCKISYLRLNLDLAIKEPIPDAIKLKLPEIKDAIRWLKSFATKINEGQINEEDTTKATYHHCVHDEGKECGPGIEI